MTHTEIAQSIRRRQGHYLVYVRENQPKFFWALQTHGSKLLNLAHLSHDCKMTFPIYEQEELELRSAFQESADGPMRTRIQVVLMAKIPSDLTAPISISSSETRQSILSALLCPIAPISARSAGRGERPRSTARFETGMFTLTMASGAAPALQSHRPCSMMFERCVCDVASLPQHSVRRHTVIALVCSEIIAQTGRPH